MVFLEDMTSLLSANSENLISTPNIDIILKQIKIKTLEKKVFLKLLVSTLFI